MIEQLLKKIDKLYLATENSVPTGGSRAMLADKIETALTDEHRADLLAMIEFLEDRKKPAGQILASVMHDIYGLDRKEECFLPHSNGYAKLTKKPKVNKRKAKKK